MTHSRQPALPYGSVERWLVPAALACVVPFLWKAPVIDEESYLWIGRNLSVLRPYDWHRVWQPYGVEDGFIYAHPPLFLWFMAGVQAVSATVLVDRILCALPFVALLAWGTARWAARCTHHPHLAGGLWLASATVQLGLQDSLMIDLPAVAFATAGLALYREGLDEGDGLWKAGLLLGLALATKYSMGMVVGAVVVHLAVSVTRRRLPPALGLMVVGPMLVAPLLIEASMFAVYGRVHLWEVWVHRHDIGSGPLDARMVGVLARMALLPSPLVLLLVRPGLAAVATLLGLAALALAHPQAADGAEIAGLLLGVVLGATCLVRAATAAFSSGLRRRKGDRDDALLLGLVVLGVVGGVTLAHNYASARYLLPAATPLAILMTRSAEEVAGGKTMLRISILLSAMVALAVSVADYRFGRASVEVATSAADRAEKLLSGQSAAPAATERRFAGEWGFRYVFEQRGWTRYRPGEPLAPGAIVVVADQESPGETPRGAWEPIDRVESVDRFRLRVVQPSQGIALYAETLGAYPLGTSTEPLESATIYRVGGPPSTIPE
ncbi:MAG: hypothetical protein EXR69_08215 [Myxococcales bacterium]|nr:hypothetical protein [Myxococcales bacterium]